MGNDKKGRDHKTSEVQLTAVQEGGLDPTDKDCQRLQASAVEVAGDKPTGDRAQGCRKDQHKGRQKKEMKNNNKSKAQTAAADDEKHGGKNNNKDRKNNDHSNA